MKKLFYAVAYVGLLGILSCSRGEPNKDRPLTGGHGAGQTGVGKGNGDDIPAGPTQDSTMITRDSAVQVGAGRQ